MQITGPDGPKRTAHTHRFDCLWYEPFHTQPIAVLLIRNPGTQDGFDIALASTDTTAHTAALITRYDSRWTIETCHREALLQLGGAAAGAVGERSRESSTSEAPGAWRLRTCSSGTEGASGLKAA